MRTLLLLVAGTLFVSVQSMAQCTPGANYADSTFGAWPDTIQNFPPATVDVAYSTDLNFKVPSDAGDVDPSYSGYTIESFTVDQVQGLPAGMTYACNVASCTYAGGANGCAQISGTSSTVGLNNITIQVTATVDSGFGFSLDVPYTFTGYKINVEPQAGLVFLAETEIRFMPNPAQNDLTIRGLNGFNQVELVDLNGQVVLVQAVENEWMTLDVSGLKQGMYVLRVSNETGVYTQRFVKH